MANKNTSNITMAMKQTKYMEINMTANSPQIKKQNIVNEDVDYDKLLSSAGGFGRYQVILLFTTLPFYLFGVNVYFSQIFLTLVPPKHWCWIPELKNLTSTERRNLAIPKDDNARYGYSQCLTYDANWTELVLTGQTFKDTSKTVPCENGWEFDRSEFTYPTISTDLGWVCNKNSYQATAQSIFFTGSVVGGILVGWVADRFGRIPAVVGSNLLGCIGGASSTFAKDITQFSICRFIMGMAHDNCVIMVFLITLEYMAPKYRSVLSNATFGIFYSLFATMLPFIALACGDWKTLSLVTSVPLALAIFTPIFLPESPRWLLSKGRIDETIEKIMQISRRNRQKVPKYLINKFKDTASKERHGETVSYFEVFKRPLLLKISILVCLEFVCCQIVFDGIIRNLKQLNFDFFLTFAASSSTELPSLLLCAFIMDYFGRRWMTVTTMIISSVSCLLIVFVETGVPSVVCSVIARFAVNMAINIATQWSAELLPTPVRGLGVSLFNICGHLAVVISPYVAYLEVYIRWLPFVVIAAISALGAIIGFMLPETAMKDMPHTYEDAEELARRQTLWEMPCLSKTKKECKDHVNPSFDLNT